MNSIVFEYDTEEGSRTFYIRYRVGPSTPAGPHDPGQSAIVELLEIECTGVELWLDNHPEHQRSRLVKRHGGVPDSIVGFVPRDWQSRRLADWFRREVDRWPDLHAEVVEACLADAQARRETLNA